LAKKILVVDDEPDLLKVTLLRLNKTGYETFSGADSQEANDEELIKKARETRREVLWKKY
jgi:CheY-like chemotaxis protein